METIIKKRVVSDAKEKFMIAILGLMDKFEKERHRNNILRGIRAKKLKLTNITINQKCYGNSKKNNESCDLYPRIYG
jgi:DNA invertase Pin-like site-specific DNA recombinase